VVATLMVGFWWKWCWWGIPVPVVPWHSANGASVTNTTRTSYAASASEC
jgi:hypothetical protein